MRKGSVVMVELANGVRVEMVVWQQLDSSVLVCRPEAYQAAKKSHTEPVTVEYSKTFITAPASKTGDT